jgi:hypothetical protein
MDEISLMEESLLMGDATLKILLVWCKISLLP